MNSDQGKPAEVLGGTLDFSGPFIAYSDEHGILPNCPVSTCCGIYLWTVQVGSANRITYVGETTTSFRKRITQHVHHCLDGYERISSAAALREGRQEILWDGLWRKDRRDKLDDFLEQKDRLVAAAMEELLIQRLFLVPMLQNRRILRRTEGAIASHLRTDAEAGSLLPKEVRYHLRKPNEDPIHLRLTAPCAILGLPREIVV